MKKRKNQKGFVLFLVSSVVLVLLAGLIGLLYILNASTRNLQTFKERIGAFYLCETGASVAMLDIRRGCIGSSGTARGGCPDVNAGNKWLTRTFDYYFGGNAYKIKYTVSKVDNEWSILSEVGKEVDPSGPFTRKYKLKVGGRRGFVIFILRAK